MENLIKTLQDKFCRIDSDTFWARGPAELAMDLLAHVRGTLGDNAFPLMNEVESSVQSQSSNSTFWRNPEIYPPLTAILRAEQPSGTEKHLLTLLSQLTGNRSLLKPQTGSACRFFHEDEVVYRWSPADGFSRYANKLSALGNDCLLIWPVHGLYTDLVGEDLYPSDGNDEITPTILRTCFDGWALVERLCPDLFRDMTQLIGAVILTPDFGHPTRWSYNLRLRYFSGVFINVFRTNKCAFAESLVHEYCHQRLWLWWSYDSLLPVSYDQITVQSPVTGNNRNARVMLHALIIYAIALGMAKGLLNDDEISVAEKEWAQNRIGLLSKAVPQLAERLLAVLTTTEDRARSVIEHVLETI
jgi:hypothetical protein